MAVESVIISSGVARLGHLSGFLLKIKLFLMIIKIICNFSPPSLDFKGEALLRIALTGSRKSGNSHLGKIR